jgi:type I restriction enzyme S subunit
VQSVRVDDLLARRLSIPPLQEQRRIVAAVETLLARGDATRDRLVRVPEVLQRFRQSVLAAAYSGRLTEAWRESAHPFTDVTAYLKEVAVIRRRAFDESARARGGRRKYPVPDAAQADDLPAIPPQWQWQSADAVCSQITDGEHIQPRYQSVGRPMLTATHVRNGYVEFSNFGLISEKDFKLCLQRCAPSQNDLLIVSVGATTGRAALVDACPPFAIVRSVLLLRPLMDPKFLLRWVQSPWCFRWMTNASGASAQPHLYIGDTKRMPVPIPPPEEQAEIVRRVEALFSTTDEINKRVAASISKVSGLPQSILARAFSGELTPTEAELARLEGRPYESAQALLERIARERGQDDTPSTPHHPQGKRARAARPGGRPR